MSKPLSEARKARLLGGLSLDDVALVTRIDTSILSKIERGILVPREDQKFLIATALGKDAKEIFPES